MIQFLDLTYSCEETTINAVHSAYSMSIQKSENINKKHKNLTSGIRIFTSAFFFKETNIAVTTYC